MKKTMTVKELERSVKDRVARADRIENEACRRADKLRSAVVRYAYREAVKVADKALEDALAVLLPRKQANDAVLNEVAKSLRSHGGKVVVERQGAGEALWGTSPSDGFLDTLHRLERAADLDTKTTVRGDSTAFPALLTKYYAKLGQMIEWISWEVERGCHVTINCQPDGRVSLYQRRASSRRSMCVRVWEGEKSIQKFLAMPFARCEWKRGGKCKRH